MTYSTPETCGIASKHVLAFYKELESQGLATHAVILSRGDRIFSECYWSPFTKDFKHRMYSVTKSFVSIAIGFCLQDGLLTLDDPLVKFFPEYSDQPYQHTSTIGEMLKMTTTIDSMKSWFHSGTTDRAQYYFTQPPQKFPGTTFKYDSAGSFLLGVIVKKVTGKPFLIYLREKCLNDIGFSKEAYCLKCPGGHEWADSGLMCTAQDLWLFARFILNKGKWNAKQYLDPSYITDATTMQVANNAFGFYNTHNVHGYGYQFWIAPDECFSAKGLGGQLAFCDPNHDFIFIINSNNQGNDLKYEPIYRALYTHILPHLSEPMSQDPTSYNKLTEYLSDRKLFYLRGATQSPIADQINGKRFHCQNNPLGIQWLRLSIQNASGVLEFENTQGVKTIPFGFGYNEFAKFPQEGYSDLVGTISKPGHKYDAAFSADWPTNNTLRIRVQIMDKYFGNLSIILAFRDKNNVSVRMEKAAEAFLNEYTGLFNATAL